MARTLIKNEALSSSMLADFQNMITSSRMSADNIRIYVTGRKIFTVLTSQKPNSELFEYIKC